MSPTMESMPTLPAERRRQLTPSSSREALRTSRPVQAMQMGALFRLPPELRRKILVEAFGGSVVHVDLVHGHPMIPLDLTAQSKRSEVVHGRVNVDWSHGMRKPRLRLDYWAPKRWIWRSSVCHRGLPTSPNLSQAICPAQDQCRNGVTYWDTCSSWPGKWPGKCCIGVLGWLLSCRQAYVPCFLRLFEARDGTH